MGIPTLFLFFFLGRGHIDWPISNVLGILGTFPNSFTSLEPRDKNRTYDLYTILEAVDKDTSPHTRCGWTYTLTYMGSPMLHTTCDDDLIILHGQNKILINFIFSKK
jgi:hypothetical protein